MNFKNKYVYYTVIGAFLAIGLFFAISIGTYLGYAGTAVPAEAGTITAIIVDDRRQTAFWHGLFGLAFTEAGFGETQSAVLNSGEITSEIFVFECIDPNQANQEIYASTNESPDFGNVRVGSFEMIDVDILNVTNDTTDTAERAFANNGTFTLGGTVFNNVPTVYTYRNSLPDTNGTFQTGILNESGRVLLVSTLLLSSEPGFKNTNVRYQMLLPIKNGSQQWYFFADPNDECPAGLSISQIGPAKYAGYVLENGTGLPIPNATVTAGGNFTFTDSNGFYNLSVSGGLTNNVVAYAEGYITNITVANTTVGNTTLLNFTLPRFYGYKGLNGTVYGWVRDNVTQAVIPNATILVGGLIIQANGSGNFSFNISDGVHAMGAVAAGYQNFVDNITVPKLQNLSVFVNMTTANPGPEPINGTVFENGTIIGYARDAITNLPLVGVVVTITGVSDTTNGSGFYNITTYEGETNIVAVQSGYESYFSLLNVSPNNTTRFDFNMSPLVVSAANGTLAGTVTSTDNVPLEDVSVSIVGKTNLSDADGFYNLTTVSSGTHNIVATASGYENYFAAINITAGVDNFYNFSMETTTEAGLGPGQGIGQGPGQGAGDGAGLGPGQGPGTGLTATIEQPVEIREWDVSVRKIIRKLREGNFLNVPITISNFLEESVNVQLSVEGEVSELVRIPDSTLAIDSTSAIISDITILGNVDPGVYDGFFVVSGDIQEKIPMYILVLDPERIDVEALVIKVKPEKKKVTAGTLLKYRVDLQNLLEEENYRVDLEYRLEGITTNHSLFIEDEDVTILTSFSLLKQFELPDDLPPGDYVLKVNGRYLGIESSGQAIFTVVEPWWKYKLFGFIPLWWILLGVLGIGLIWFGIWYYKKKQNEKKRYQIDVDYNTLPKPGPRSAYAGMIAETQKKAYFDLDTFQIHTLVAGSTGGGKSVATQVLVEEALLKGASVMVFDPTVQWTGFLRKCTDKGMLGFYKRFGMNKNDARAFNGNIRQVENAREIIDFQKFQKAGEINVFVVNKLEPKDYEIFVSNIIRQIFHANMPENRQLKLLMVFDEFHRLLPKYGGTGQVFVQIERAAREFRKWGVGLLLISQVLTDFPKQVLANINTEIQMKTKDEGDLNRTQEKYGGKILQSLVKASVGTGMVENANNNKGKPYFISFRPLMHSTVRVTDDELKNYNKYNVIIDDLEYQLEQLEKEGVDSFDLQLELKLAQDKVKAGSFNMVDIYLEGLKPRIAEQWKKLGKEPKKKEIQLVSEGELSEELKKASAEQKKQADAQDAIAAAKAAQGKPGETPAKAATSAKSDTPQPAAAPAATPAAKPEPAAPIQTSTPEQNESARVNAAQSAIAAAKAAQQKSASEENEEVESSKAVTHESLLADIHAALDSGDKTKLTTLYGQLQALYKTASPDDKKKIVAECKIIAQKLQALKAPAQ